MDLGLVRAELSDTLNTNIFRGSWIPIRGCFFDIISVIQAYTQYDKRISLRRFKSIYHLFRSRVNEDSNSKVLVANLDTIIDILSFFIPSSIKDVRDYIATNFSGQVNVLCKWGKIDVLSDREMFIIEDVEKWESAFGRIITCSSCFPTHSPVLVIKTDENDDDEFLQFIKQICDDYDIKTLRVFKKDNQFNHLFMIGCERCGSELVEVDVDNENESANESNENNDIENEDERKSDDESSECEDDCECNECKNS